MQVIVIRKQPLICVPMVKKGKQKTSIIAKKKQKQLVVNDNIIFEQSTNMLKFHARMINWKAIYVHTQKK